MYRFRSGDAKKRLVISITLASLALVVLWLGFRGSPPQLARDFEECVEQVQAKLQSNDERALMTDCYARFAGRRKAGGGYTYYDFMQDRNFDMAGPNPTVERSASRSIASIWLSSMPNSEKISRLNWQKDRTNSSRRIWKARVNLSGHRWY
jgi:hypothetical protein